MKKSDVKLPKNWGKLKNEKLLCIEQQAHALYLHDMKHLHPKVKPVSFDKFIKHCRENVND